MTGHGSMQGMDFDPQVKAWMKAHTVGDLKVLATSMECKGEDASVLREFVQALSEIEDGQMPRMGSI